MSQSGGIISRKSTKLKPVYLFEIMIITEEIFDDIRDQMCNDKKSPEIAEEMGIKLSVVQIIGACYNWDEFQMRRSKRLMAEAKARRLKMSDPGYAEEKRARERERWHRRMQDPKYAEKERIRSRERARAKAKARKEKNGTGTESN